MTNREVINRVRTNIKENYADSILTNKFIYSILKTVASFLLNRESNKSKIYFQSELWQTLCVEMIKVNSVECFDFPTDCTIWRSKDKLPALLETDMGFFYKSITSLDKSISFSFTTAAQSLNKSKLKNNPRKYVWLENRYLYSLSAFPQIKIVGYFENDLELKCSKLDNTFYCPLYLIDVVVQQTLKELTIYKQLPYPQVEDKNQNT